MRSDEGQALVVVALVVVVLIGSLAFAVDWGYAMVQRRAMQNLADASGMAAGKRLATAVIKVNGAVKFSVTQEQTWCSANSYANPTSVKGSFAPAGTSNTLQLWYGDASDPTVWTASVTTCTGNTEVPASTIYVRAAVTVSFRSLFAAASAGHSSSVASATARVRLSGTPVPLVGGPMWAMVRHYNPTDFNNTCTANPCDPTDPNQVQPKLFWDSQAADVAFGNFKGLIDFSHYSPSFNTVPLQTTQLISGGDSWAHPPNAYAIDRSGQNQCPWGQDAQGNKLWDSWGEADSTKDTHCSIPNWVYYGFRGTLNLDSHWSGGSLPAGQEPPQNLGTRPSVCATPPDPAPSCADPTMGDWVETAGGTIASLTDIVRVAVADRGSMSMPFSNKVVPGTTTPFGKGLVVLVFLWECGEKFSKNGGAGNRWDLIVPGGQNPDCSQLNSAPDRVHLFTVAPFTIYEGTISSGSVKGYWGGLFGSADSCQSCVLNGLANTAVMVGD